MRSEVHTGESSDRSQRRGDAAASQFGDVERDERIYRSHAPELVRFANSLVGPSDAQDVVSSAVLRAFTSKSWPTVENPRAYLYKAVLNEVRSDHRSTMRRRARELRTPAPHSTEMPEVRPDVYEALGKLSARQRAVAFLTYIEDLDESAVADRLGISTGSVRQHLGRARAKLRTILDE
ncbi:MAG: sigma-70 family RNA polymerase sigma factor [Acidimicrobiia bacterium]|nr:sigma-70 family RNA polymerase sigma factor [Acidimicrobiia bacterium]